MSLERKSRFQPEYRAFLRRLRQARKDAGLRQTEVAEALGRPQSYVSKSESGERLVDVIDLWSFATLYKVSLSYFFGDAAEKARAVPSRKR